MSTQGIVIQGPTNYYKKIIECYKNIPNVVWSTWDEGNKPKMVISRTHQLPEHRQWRNAWQISDDIKLAA